MIGLGSLVLCALRQCKPSSSARHWGDDAQCRFIRETAHFRLIWVKARPYPESLPEGIDSTIHKTFVRRSGDEESLFPPLPLGTSGGTAAQDGRRLIRWCGAGDVASVADRIRTRRARARAPLPGTRVSIPLTSRPCTFCLAGSSPARYGLAILLLAARTLSSPATCLCRHEPRRRRPGRDTPARRPRRAARGTRRTLPCGPTSREHSL